MTSIKVGIVEDEMLIALSIEQALRGLGYEIAWIAISYTEALEMIATTIPDILLMDIKLKGHKDGIDLAEKVRREYNIPYIFLTANADTATVTRAKEQNPHAYLVKPFSKDDLYAAIEVCFHNFASASRIPHTAKSDPVIKDSIFIKQGQKHIKVKIEDITCVESSDIYLYVYTLQSKLLVRNSLQGFMAQVNEASFLRVHKSYVVNVNYIDTVAADQVEVSGHTIPIGRAYKESVMNFLSIG